MQEQDYTDVQNEDEAINFIQYRDDANKKESLINQ